MKPPKSAKAGVVRIVHKRARMPKVRTGCQPCKEAHVKCTEQKPKCARCERMQLACMYSPRPEPSNASEKGRKLRSIMPLVSAHNQPARLIEPGFSRMEPKEVIYFDYFRHEVVKQLGLGGYGDFWFRTVLREGTVDDCVLQAILGLGALAQAQRSNPSTAVPMYKMSMSNRLSSNSYYYDSLFYYTDSLARIRNRISQNQVTPRTLLIVSILLAVYELLQGNTASVDQLMAYSIRALKDIILRAPVCPTGGSLIAAPIDDEGVREAEFLLVRMTCFNAAYSPLYPNCRESLLLCSFHHLDSPAPPSNTQSTEVFWNEWMRSMTLHGHWYIYASSAMRQESPSSLNGELKQEQDSQLSKIKTWQSAIREKLASEPSQFNRRILKHLILSTNATYYSLLTVLDVTATSWYKHKPATMDMLAQTQSVIDNIPPAMRDQVMIGEGPMPIIAQVARECRDMEVRQKAMSLWKSVVSCRSSWDMKGFFMGTSAVVGAEERGRNSNGTIPITAQYEWTCGSWNEDHTKFQVTLNPKVTSGNGPRQETHISLSTEDYGLLFPSGCLP